MYFIVCINPNIQRENIESVISNGVAKTLEDAERVGCEMCNYFTPPVVCEIYSHIATLNYEQKFSLKMVDNG